MDTVTRDLDPRRAARAAEALADGRTCVRPGPEPGVWIVSSFTGPGAYRVSSAPPSCTCPDARIRGSVCKHRLLIALMEGLT